MDQTQWQTIRDSVRRQARKLPRNRRLIFNDTHIVLMYFWAVMHDRAMMWACDRKNYTHQFRPRKLPSISQFHRRVKSDRVLQLLQWVQDDLAGVDVPTSLMSVDGKSMTINPVGQDPDARYGYASGGKMGLGYKLHAYVTEDRRILCWCVRPLNEHEMPIATLMLAHLPQPSERSLILADCNYDSHSFHKAVHAKGARLVCGLRGKAEHPVTLRQMGEARRELLELDQQNNPLLSRIRRERITIEQTFSTLTATSGGLGPLPGFVRRLPRVRRWVGAKICLYHARLRTRKSCRLKKD